MKHNLLKKLLIASAITTALSACGTGDGNQELFDKDLQPATYSGDLVIVHNEGDEITAYDLLQGVTNPEESNLVARSLKYLRVVEDEEGVPVQPEQPLYIGPAMPLQAAYQSENTLYVVPPAFNPSLLVHEATISRYGNKAFDPDPLVEGEEGEVLRYTEAVYNFTYLIDNGSLVETIPRNIKLTILAEEVIAESIDAPESLEVGENFFAQLDAQIMPLDTTYDILTYAVSDETKATIDQNGLVTAVALGAFDITITSEDGNVIKTIPSETVVVTDPLAVDINVAGVKQSAQVDIAVESMIDFDALLLPDLGFTNDVVWTSSNAEVVSIDALTGIASALVLSEDPDEVAEGINEVTITATITREGRDDLVKTTILTVIENNNLLFFSDADFESGSLDLSLSKWIKHWTNPAGAVIEITTEASKSGMYGVHIQSSGTEEAGIYLGNPDTPQTPGSIENGKFKFSYDIKVNNWDGISQQEVHFNLIPSSNWDNRIEIWHKTTPIVDGWVHGEFNFDASTWPPGDGYFVLQMKSSMPGGIDVYLDNIVMEEITE